MTKLDHAEWQRWCDVWNKADFKSYPDFNRWQNASEQADQEAALAAVMRQAKAAGDAKMARAVYRHAPYGTAVKRDALSYVLEYARKTSDKLLARDVYQHSGDIGYSETALAVYKEITGEELTY